MTMCERNHEGCGEVLTPIYLNRADYSMRKGEIYVQQRFVKKLKKKKRGGGG